MRSRLTPITVLIGVSALSVLVGLTSSLWIRALSPQLAVTRSYYRETRLYSLWPSPSEEDPAKWDPPALDPWNRPWRVVGINGFSGFGYYFHLYSMGPNGLDDAGDGDDLWATPDDEDRRQAAVISRRPSWPVLYLDVLLMLGVPGALWWTWSLARLWSSPRQPVGREASLCVVVASVPAIALAWRLLALPAPVAMPWSTVDPGLALATTGALGIVLATAALRAWRWTRTSPPA